MSTIDCAGTEPKDTHVNAVGVSPVATSGTGTSLTVLDIPAAVDSTITSTNFTFGDATQESYHLLDGKTMYFWWRVIFGATSTFTTNPFGITITGSTPRLGAGDVKDGMPVGVWKLSDAPLANHYYGSIILNATGGDLRFRNIDDSSSGSTEAFVAEGNPLTFGNGVVWSGFASYEVT